jgi:hypothetical protein
MYSRAVSIFNEPAQSRNAVLLGVLGSIPASFDTVKSEELQMKQCRIKYIKLAEC